MPTEFEKFKREMRSASSRSDRRALMHSAERSGRMHAIKASRPAAVSICTDDGTCLGSMHEDIPNTRAPE